MVSKYSLPVAVSVAATWAIARQPIIDFALIGFAMFIAISLIAWAGWKRDPRFLLVVAMPWITICGFMQFAAYEARSKVSETFRELPSVSEECTNTTCIAMMASGTPFSVGGTSGFLVESLGASIYVKVFTKSSHCRALEDELLGRARVIQWQCNVGEKS